MNKSQKRIQELENNDVTLFTKDGDRLIKVYKDYDYDYYILVAGYEFLPSDYEETHDTLDDLLASMSETQADGRKWQYFNWAE